MTMFMLETDSATSTSSQIKSLADQLDSISSNVDGYDTSATEFDFSGPKGVLAASIKACATKMLNTSNYLESVVSSHQSFQDSIKFETAEEKAAKEKAAQAANNNSYSGGNSSYGGGGSHYGGGGGSSSGSPETQTEVPTTPETTPEMKPIEAKEVTDQVKKITTKDIDEEKLEDGSKKIFDKVEYDEDGYAKYDDMYVIACATSIGTVGDIIEITTKDGKTIKCIVGMNDDELKDEIQFVVNDKWKEDNEKNITTGLIDKIEKVVNKAPGQPALGVYTKEYKTEDQKWTVVDTKGNLKDYLEEIKNKVSQSADKEKYSDKSLSFAETHAYSLYSGKSGISAEEASQYKYSGQFVSYKTDDLKTALNKIYTEVSNGRPVVIQVNGNQAGTKAAFVTVVGFKDTITDPSKLTEKDLLIVDSWDGKVERMDQTNSRFLTTGKDTHKSYSGYYMRVLKDGQPEEVLNAGKVQEQQTASNIAQTLSNNSTGSSQVQATTLSYNNQTPSYNTSTISTGGGLIQENYNSAMASISTPSKADIISKAQELGLSEDYIKTVIGTTQNEGYVGDPYLNYGWSSAMINNPVSSETVYSWGGGNDYYSAANINRGYENASDEVLKSVYLALTNRNTKIAECDGMYSQTPSQYNLLYSSPNYNCKIYETK